MVRHPLKPFETDAKRNLVVVGAASWKALYEIRANTESKVSPIEIIYKAAIKQDSGEVRELIRLLKISPY